MSDGRAVGRKVAASVITIGAVLLGIGLRTPVGATGPESNDVSYWCEHGVKLEPVSTPFIVPTPPDGWMWTKLVIKTAQTTVVVDDPVVGQAYTSGVFNQNGVEQSISHVILCKQSTSTTTTTTQPGATTTTTQPGATTTTQPGATTTQPGATTTQPGATTTTQPGATTTTVEQAGPTSSVGQAGPTSTAAQSSGGGSATTTTTDPRLGRLPATGGGDGSGSLMIVALTLMGIGFVMLRLASNPKR